MGNQYIGIRPRCIRKPALLPSGQKQANIKSAGLSSKFFGSDSTSKGKMLDQIRSAPDRKQKCPVVRPFRHHRHRKRGGMPAKGGKHGLPLQNSFFILPLRTCIRASVQNALAIQGVPVRKEEHCRPKRKNMPQRKYSLKLRSSSLNFLLISISTVVLAFTLIFSQIMVNRMERDEKDRV